LRKRRISHYYANGAVDNFFFGETDRLQVFSLELEQTDTGLIVGAHHFDLGRVESLSVLEYNRDLRSVTYDRLGGEYGVGLNHNPASHFLFAGQPVNGGDTYHRGAYLSGDLD
jgi:hypothetical protein